MDSEVRTISLHQNSFTFKNHSSGMDVTQYYGQVDYFSLDATVSIESSKIHGGPENVLKATSKNVFQHLPFYDKPEHKVINNLITKINQAVLAILAKPWSWTKAEIDQKVASVLCLWNSEHGKIYKAGFLYTPSRLTDSELFLAQLALVPWSSSVETEQMAILTQLEPAEDTKKCFPAVSSVIGGIFRGISAHGTTLVANPNNSSDQDQEPLIDGEN